MENLLAALDRRRIFIPVSNGEMAALRFGSPGAPPLLFAHANGFCASAYRQMFEALGARYDAFVVDLRGYGASRLPADPSRHRSMRAFADDIAAFIANAANKYSISEPWTLSGHSLGGSSVTIAAAMIDKVAALKLVEPVAMPRLLNFIAMTPVWPFFAARMPLVRGARARRGVWPDREAVRVSYSKKPLFSTWAPGVLEDYLADGLTSDPEGVALSCAPAWEAAAFAGHGHDFWGAVARAPRPFKVLAARHASSTVPDASVRRFERRGVRVERIAGFTHLAPFEAPEIAAAFLAAP
jgi:pimeloyl-ACP methyl ester carboxylesterase